MRKNPLPAHAIILAGGRGTRFWPRSRTRTPKQLLNIVGSRTMLQQTIDRLLPAFPLERIWVVTNQHQEDAVRRQIPRLAPSHILAEPLGRNTAAAIGLAAAHLARTGGDALMAVLPADHYVQRAARYRRIVRAALQIAAGGPNLVVLGIPPTRPETGFGYIERGLQVARFGNLPVYAVRRFTEKPPLPTARKYMASRRYYWNAGMFFWRVSTFLNHLKKSLPATHNALMQLAGAIGTRRYARTLRRIYPKLESISVDYAIMEPATRARGGGNVFVLPAAVGWSDIGSWAAVYELQARKAGENVTAASCLTLDAVGNYVWAPKKFAALVGVSDLVVVETDDALLICPRERAQDVGKVVKWLERRGLPRLL